MKIMFQALQAVTVELTGILLIVWLLFGCASWGIRTTTSEYGDWNGHAPAILNNLNSQVTEVIPVAPVYQRLGMFKQS
jgi:hypothetical protein